MTTAVAEEWNERERAGEAILVMAQVLNVAKVRWVGFSRGTLARTVNLEEQAWKGPWGC